MYDSKLLKFLTVAPRALSTPLGIEVLERSRLEKYLNQWKPDVILATFPLWSGFSDFAKSIGSKLALWIVDEVELRGGSLEFMRRCDLILTASRGGASLFAEKNLPRPKWMPFGYDPRYFYPLTAEKRYAITFVGTFRPRTYLDALLRPLIGEYGPTVHLFGKGWQGNNSVRGATTHRVVDWREIAKVYAESEIVLGMHTTDAIRYNRVNARVYEALGCRAFFISDFVPSMAEILTPGRDFVALRDGDDVISVAREYLQEKDLRLRIAESGHARVKKQFTVRKHTVMMSQLFDSL